MTAAKKKTGKVKIEKEVTLKVVKWFDANTREILYGVDIKINGKWSHLADGKPCIYKTEHEASQKIKEFFFDK